MNYSAYKQRSDEIINNANPEPPYNNEMYMHYTKLNRSRMKRWDKQIILDTQLVSQLHAIPKPQHWIIISEPWCGDAAHILPFLIKMTEQNDLITYDIQLRDSEPFLIQQYLTNGSKSIPKLIVRDAGGNDIFVWGPRPKGAQELMDKMKEANADFETTIMAMQNWYNSDKGQSLYRELSDQLRHTNLYPLLP